MACFAGYKPTFKQVAAGKKKEPPKKRPLQISEELHGLISLLAKDNNQSLEQVVAGAVIQRAKSALNTPDNDRQRAYYERIRRTEQEIRQRYHGEQSRRSAQMRKINNERRIKIAPTRGDFLTLSDWSAQRATRSANTGLMGGRCINLLCGTNPLSPRQYRRLAVWTVRTL